MPWGGLLADLDAVPGPADLQAAAKRLANRGEAETRPGFSAAMTLGVTNTPSVIHGFDRLGRGEGQTQLVLDHNSRGTSLRLALGAFSGYFRGRSVKFMPDGSFLAQRLGDDVLLYGGWLTHWWGPGWISALALSDNARPMPQVGL